MEPTVGELFDLAGKRALITGATGHLGSAMSRALAEAGASVVAASRDIERAKALAARLPRRGDVRHCGAEFDYLAPDRLEAQFAAAVEGADAIDILVNNGHEPESADWTSITAEQFTRQLSNATGYFVLARLVRNHAVERRRPASIMLLGSL